MQLSECLGGWCFYNEGFLNEEDYYTEENQYGENIRMARFVNRGKVTQDIFGDYYARILEINSKTGLYPLYMAYSIFKTSKEKAFRESQLTGERGKSVDSEGYYRQAGNDLEIWKDVLQDNIFVVCRTKMAVSITKRTLAGFRKDVRMNVRCYEQKVAINDLINASIIKKTDEGITQEGKTFYFNGEKEILCDMIDVLRAKPEIFEKDIVQGKDFWHVYNSIPKSKNEDINDMRFKAVVGNPPYMITSDVNNRQTPIYHYFYNSAEKLSDIYSFITPARFLFNAGLTPPEWNKKMLEDEHLKVVYFSQDSSKCFPNVEIKGGVAIMYRNANEDFGPIGQFIPNENLNAIASKFIEDPKNNLTAIMYGGRSDLKFNDEFLKAYPNSKADRLAFIQIKRSNVTVLSPNEEYELKSSTFEALPYVFKEEVEDKSKYYHLLGLIGAKRVWRYIERTYMSPRYPQKNNIDKYKVFVPESNGGGFLGEVLTNPIIGYPGDSSSTTFISIGAFDTKEEAENCLSYIKTKFVRCLLGILKTTQHNPPSVWAYIPMQNFTEISDIDWRKSISDIDKQLYAKYHLEEDIEYIESVIKPME